ncbi:MAG: MFS transporter [Bacteroidales bacterium]
MTERSTLLSPGFVLINLQFGLITTITALFFLFSGYLSQMGFNPATGGLILSADSLAAFIVQPLITPLIHAGNARRWLLGGAILFSLSLFMLGQLSAIPLLIAARLLQGAGFICVLSSLITMLIPFIPPGMSGRAFGYVSLVRLVPYAVIPMVSDFVAFQPSSFSLLLDVAAVAALLPILMLMMRRQSTGEPHPDPGSYRMIASLRSRPVVLLLISSLLFYCGYSSMFFYFKQYGLFAGITRAGLFFSIATFVMIGIRLFGSGLFDRYDKAKLGATGLFALAVCYGVMPWCHSAAIFICLAVVTGLGWGIAMPLQAAAMFDISLPPARALNQNLLLIMMQGGFFLGPLLGGQLIAGFGYTALFACLATSSLAAAVMMNLSRQTSSGQPPDNNKVRSISH